MDSVTVVSHEELDVRLIDNSDNETSFDLFRSTDNANWAKITMLGASPGIGGDINYSDTDLSPATTYYYFARAVNCAGASADGNVESNTTDAIAANQAPTASFAASTSGLTTSFTDASSDSDGSVVSWSWDFGDGNTSSAQHPSHAYAAGGAYNVGLTVTDDDGAMDTASQSVVVVAPNQAPVVVSVSANPVVVTLGESTRLLRLEPFFNDLSSQCNCRKPVRDLGRRPGRVSPGEPHRHRYLHGHAAVRPR